MDYISKRAVGEAEKRFLLEEDALVVESGKGSMRVPFSAIREIRLRYQPNRYESDIYECEISAAQGSFRIFSRYAAGVLDFRDQGPPYRIFVNELCLRCGRSGAPTRFSGGSPAVNYIGNGLFAIVGMAFLFLALALLPFPGGFLVIVRLIVLVPMLLVSVLWFIKNKPVRFDPASIPGNLLPRKPKG